MILEIPIKFNELLQLVGPINILFFIILQGYLYLLFPPILKHPPYFISNPPYPIFPLKIFPIPVHIHAIPNHEPNNHSKYFPNSKTIFTKSQTQAFTPLV